MSAPLSKAELERAVSEGRVSLNSAEGAWGMYADELFQCGDDGAATAADRSPDPCALGVIVMHARSRVFRHLTRDEVCIRLTSHGGD